MFLIVCLIMSICVIVRYVIRTNELEEQLARERDSNIKLKEYAVNSFMKKNRRKATSSLKQLKRR